jgi:Glycosyltransferase
MKLLITTEFYYPKLTGVVTAVVNQKKALLDSFGDWEVRIMTIGDTKTSYYDEKEGVYYIRRMKWQPYPDSYASLSLGDSLVKEIISWHPDVVHAQCEFFTLSFAKKIAKACKAPLFETCHTDFDEYYMHFTKCKKGWDLVVPRVVRARLKCVKKIVCPTKKISDMLDSYHVKNDKEVIPVGLDLDMFNQNLPIEERRALRAGYGIKDDDFVFVSVCRVSPEKNIKESILNFNELLKTHENIKLLIVGDGTDLDNLIKLTDELKLNDYVVFTRRIDSKLVWKYFKLGEVFISASRSEIQGLTYIEALAAGIPLLCRKDQSLDGTLVYGENGYSYEGQEDFLEKADILIAQKDKLVYFHNNAAKSVTKYGLKVFADRLNTIYTTELSARREK